MLRSVDTYAVMVDDLKMANSDFRPHQLQSNMPKPEARLGNTCFYSDSSCQGERDCFHGGATNKCRPYLAGSLSHRSGGSGIVKAPAGGEMKT